MNEFGEIIVDLNCKNCGVKLKDDNASCSSLAEELCQICEHAQYE